MIEPTKRLILLGCLLAIGSAMGQAPQPDAASSVAIRLEPHAGQTAFQIGDPIFVDLVFTGGRGGRSADTDNNPAQPLGDIVYVSPDGGWIRTHQSITGKGINGNAIVPLKGNVVRVPVLLNRVIEFQQPGDYSVSIATGRLVDTGTFRRVEQFIDCDPCPATNSVLLHIFQRPASDEAELVSSFSQTLEKTRSFALGDGLTPEEKRELAQEIETVQAMPNSPEKQSNQKALLPKLSLQAERSLSSYKQKEKERRLAAEGLAYLTGDEALRAKVHFIVQESGRTDADLVSFILIDGLPASRNKQLQLDLLDAAWRDPQFVPNDILHTALADARDLAHGVPLRERSFGTTADERKAYWDQYEKDLAIIVATLQARSPSNRDQTIEFLKKIAVPNAFNRVPSNH